MPADLNRVTLVGRLTRDPELRQTAGGTSVCSIRLAVTSRTNRGGEWSDQSNYFDVTIFGRQAETAETYLSKGRRIGVDGRLSWREWQAQDGTKRQSVEVIANDIFFLDSRGEGTEGGGGYGNRGGWGDAPPKTGGRSGSDMPVDTTDMSPPAASDDDDIPF
jgi:single-strand DNA-binding protein